MDDVHAERVAMATRVSVRARCAGAADLEPALDVFTAVDRACTRFDPDSPLMRANSHPDRWNPVPPVCFDALVAAARAHQMTRGRFDPRVLTDLVRLGYDRSFDRIGQDGATDPRPRHRAHRNHSHRPAGPWRPAFRGGPSPEVRIGRDPVDLGGIGKGLAVRWATHRLLASSSSFLVDAGGDCFAAGDAPDGGAWRIGVEDPTHPDRQIAVLAVRDEGCATSSTRVRRWRSEGDEVHHLIDPVAHRPGGEGLTSVTVVHRDPADAEVWAKALFLTGARGIERAAAARGLAALWVDTEGQVAFTRHLRRHLIWIRTP